MSKENVNLENVKVEMSPEEKEAQFLAARETELLKKYKRIVPGSIQRETEGVHAGKLTVVIKCKTPDCPNTRRVATSDLFQVQYCEECVRTRRLAKRRQKAKAARTEKAEKTPKAEKAEKAEKTKKGKKRGHGKKIRPVVASPDAAPVEASAHEAVAQS